MKTLITLTLAASLAGCGSLDMKSVSAQMENRLVLTLDCQRGFLASLWWKFGFTSEIDGKDVKELPCHKVGVPATSASGVNP